MRRTHHRSITTALNSNRYALHSNFPNVRLSLSSLRKRQPRSVPFIRINVNHATVLSDTRKTYCDTSAQSMPGSQVNGIFAQFRNVDVAPRVSVGRTSSFNTSKHTQVTLTRHRIWN